MQAFATERSDNLDILAGHCIAARDVIDQVGTSVMRQLIDLLLFEIGIAIAEMKTAEAEPTQNT